jgi:hypothetical protein
MIDDQERIGLMGHRGRIGRVCDVEEVLVGRELLLLMRVALRLFEWLPPFRASYMVSD